LPSSFATSYAGVMALVAVVNECSFAKAGDRLGIGGSAVSRSLQKLEDQLKARMFLRGTRSTTLKHAIELFYEHCHPGMEYIVQAFRSCGGGVSQLPDGRRPQTIAKQLIPMQMVVCASASTPKHTHCPRPWTSCRDNPAPASGSPRAGSSSGSSGVDGLLRKFMLHAIATFNDTAPVLQAMLAQLAASQACNHRHSGELVSCLARHAPDNRSHFICYPSRQHLQPRIRVFVTS
jgi:DNA-binding transcriptional LysR family regulator